jgi:hypothetical protein
MGVDKLTCTVGVFTTAKISNTPRPKPFPMEEGFQFCIIFCINKCEKSIGFSNPALGTLFY